MNQNIEQLSILEQNLSSLVLQRQTLQKQILEHDHALSELEQAQDAYQIVGTIMIKKSASSLQEELASKTQTLKVKVESILKQEETVRKQLNDAQAAVMKEMNKEE